MTLFHFILTFISCLFLFLVEPTFADSRILVLGDSLSAAYQIPVESGWVKLLEKKLNDDYPDWKVVNASISGETARNGLQRVPKLLEQFEPAIVIVELGGNDGLRGVPLTDIHKNLVGIVELCQKSNAKILLIGIKLPPNYGPAYTDGFADIYTRISQQFSLPLVPFLLEGIATKRRLMQDGIHPTADAQSIIVDNVWPHLEPLLKS